MGAGAVILVMAAVTFFTLGGPQLNVSFDIPESVAIGKPFLVTIEVSNPHAEDLVLDSIDIPDRVFERFEFVSTLPKASSDSPLGAFGTQTWYFRFPLQPGESKAIELELLPQEIGTHLVELAVCGPWAQCSPVSRPIEVSAEQEAQFGLRLIVVKTEIEAADLRAQIEAGAYFEELATERSLDPSSVTGGYLGTIVFDDLRKEFQDALAGLIPGELSPITRIGDEYALLQLTDN